MHGKGVRSGDRLNQIDLGNNSAIYYLNNTRDETNIINPIYKHFLENITAIYVGDSEYLSTTEPNVAHNPEYKGLWGNKSIHTMNSQSSIMGIPSF
jgi:hypothetical protein